MFIAVTFPFFGGLLGFFGGFAFSPTILSPLHHVASNLQATEVLPVLVSQLDMHHVGVLLMILSPTGGLRSIILEAKDYKFYS
ncbi:hypothetical protein PanWU01x14_269330 [Parasponia andersonii]|uniref:Uncharacterized protein n=1 Tax=Parasponia andersonii TaxID=3476 RepID=A0A2P5B5C2_PARAD|nr:hypothetical protein PanWU01x14_269330 [Parasponia andersonii]